MIAMAVGAALALLALGYVLYPLLVRAKPGMGSVTMACLNCGARAESDARFCSDCGQPVTRLEENDRIG